MNSLLISPAKSFPYMIWSNSSKWALRPWSHNLSSIDKGEIAQMLHIKIYQHHEFSTNSE